ncbi:HRDC domain-containing protein [Paenibacillus sp. GYB003]|uniref:HRDC domain-containing protein n=1 Tax=Paenibacillus sp. GYB003 TaxID=2994392 RepID=UPI002F96106C
MNLVFLNRFEKEGEQEGVVTAQLSIAEEFGEWHVWWHEPGKTGIPAQESWYKGTEWEQMIAEFRARLSEKRQAGYRPLVEFAAGREQASAGRAAFLRKLDYYAEQHADDALFEALRRWRNGQAANEGKSAFIVASNRLLKLVSAFKPQTMDELLQIPGFGEYKAGLYGQDLLALTAAVDRQTAFPLDWVEEAVDGAAAEQWAKDKQEERRNGATSKRELKRKLLEAIRAGKTLDEMEPLFAASRRELVTCIEELDKEGYDLEPLIAAELETVPPQLVEQAWSAFAKTGGRYLRPILQKLYDEKKLDEKALSRAYEWLRLLRIRYRGANIDISEPPGAEAGERHERSESA